MAKKMVTFYKISNNRLNDLAIKEGQLIVTEDTQKVYLDITDSERIELESYNLVQDTVNKYKLTYVYPDGTTNVIMIPGVRSVTTGNTNGTLLVNTDGVATEVAVAGLKSLAYKDSIAATDITSGVVPVVRGGTGNSTFVPGEVLIGAGTSALETKAIDTTEGGTANSTDLISSGAVKAGLDTKIPLAQKGSANGVATLDGEGKVPSSQLPSYIDDVLEFPTLSQFPAVGEEGKIYIALDTNKTYRWSGSTYVTIASDLALGETHSTAYYGDRGKIAYDHATDVDKISTAVNRGLYKIEVTSEGHIASVAGVQKSDITALGIPGQDTTYTAGSHITIENNVISADNGAYTAGSNIDIDDVNDIISLKNSVSIRDLTVSDRIVNGL